jgi:hypothetical protein
MKNAYIMAGNDFHRANRICRTATSRYVRFLPNATAVHLLLNAFSLDSNSRFVMIYRGGKSIS